MVSFGGTLTLKSAASASAASASATAEYALGIIGNVIAIILYALSGLSFLQIWRNRAVGQASVFPYMAGILNCLVWGLFGLPSVQPGDELMMGVNTAGMMCNIIFTVIFLYFAGEERCFFLSYAFVLEVNLSVCLGALLLTLPQTVESQIFWLGVCGAITGSLIYVVPVGMDMKKVRDLRDVQHISVLSTTATLLNAVIWVIYASVDKFDIFTFIPNTIGMVAQVFELSVYYYHNAQAP